MKINLIKFGLTRISEMFTDLLQLQYQVCGPSEEEDWLPWQSPSWLRYEENDNLSAKKKRNVTIFALLSIVFIPYANHDVPAGQVIYISRFTHLSAISVATVSLFSKKATKLFEPIVLHMYPGSAHCTFLT